MADVFERFVSYCNGTYGVEQYLRQVKDGRVGPRYGLPGLALRMMIGIVTGIRSMNQLAEAIHDGSYDGVAGTDRPSADTFIYAFKRVDRDSLVRVSDAIITKARRNKALDQTRVEGFRVVAIDGTGLFSTKSERLGHAGHHRKDVHGGSVEKERYLEHALGVQYVSASGTNLLLDLVRIPAGQGETTVARAALEDLYRRHCRFCDVVTVDAGFAGSPFLNTVLGQNKHVIVRVKQEDYNIIKDADALFEGQSPNEVHRRVRLKAESNTVYDVQTWEDEGFTSWEGVNEPLRCIRVREIRRELNAAGETIKEQEVTTHFVTDASRKIMPALTVWKIAHRRWDIENGGFHFLKHHFHLGHAYCYDPQVIEVLLTLFVMAYNLFQLFVRRNLRSFKWGRATLRGVMRQIRDGMVVVAYLARRRVREKAYPPREMVVVT
jgi:hypothetical protein